MSTSRTRASLAGALIIIAASGCAVRAENTSPDTAHASPPANLMHRPAAEDETKADYIMEMEGVLSRPYFLPSLEEFSSSALVTDVIAGTVQSVRTYVMGAGDSVYTDATLRVDAARSAKPGSLVTIRESGGTVTLDQIKSNFEGRLTEDELKQQADTTVDMRIAGQPHTQAGDRVLFFVGGDATDLGGQFAVARMVDATGSGEYRWMGEPFNPDWVSTVRWEQARESFALKSERSEHP